MRTTAEGSRGRAGHDERVRRRIVWRPLDLRGLAHDKAVRGRALRRLGLLFVIACVVSAAAGAAFDRLGWYGLELRLAGRHLAFVSLYPPLLVGVLALFWLSPPFGFALLVASNTVYGLAGGLRPPWLIVYALADAMAVVIVTTAYEMAPERIRRGGRGWLPFYAVTSLLAALSILPGAIFWGVAQGLSPAATARLVESWFVGGIAVLLLLCLPLLLVAGPRVLAWRRRLFGADRLRPRPTASPWVSLTLTALVLAAFVASVVYLNRTAVGAGGADAARVFNLLLGVVMLILLAALYGLAYLTGARTETLAAALERRTRELVRSRDRYRSLFESVPVGLFRADGAGTILDANSEFLRIVGAGAPADVPASVFSLWLDPAEAEAARRICHGGTALHQHRARWRRIDGAEVWVSLTTAHEERGEGAEGPGLDVWEGAVEDVTEQVVAQRERERLEERLGERQKIEVIGALAAGIAHDFNNLLTGIKGYAALAEADLPAGSPTRADVRRVIEYADRAAEVTKQLLTFSRRQPSRMQVLDLAAVLETACALVRPLLGERVRTRFEVVGAPVRVRGDENQLTQALMNLLINARDAMPEGGEVRVLVRRDRDGAIVEVCDEGVGMDEQLRARATEPFFTSKDDGSGTGLGLSIVAGIVRRHGGGLEIDSEPGAGTTVRVQLPLAQAPVAAAAPGAATAVLAPPGRGEKILVVEDEAAVRRWIVRALRAAGYEPLEAEGVRAAEEAARAHAAEVRLVISDVVLRDGDGLAVEERVRSLAGEVRLLLMSGYPDEVISAAELARREIAFLAKPFSPAELLTKVRQLLGVSERGGRRGA